MSRTWLITGVSSGFGYEMTKQLLEKGDVIIGTVRNTAKVEDLIQKYPVNFACRILDVTDVAAVQKTVKESFEKHGKIDAVVSNAGYGLFGCAEKLSYDEINHIIATNLTGSIQLIKTSLPYLRKQGGGRIIQLSSYGGQVAQFNIGVTIVELGGARTEFRYGSAKVTNLMDEYDSCHGFLNMLDASKGLAPGDPAKMAQRIIESVDMEKAPLRMVLGSHALSATIERLKERIADYETQTELAASTDIKGEQYMKKIVSIILSLVMIIGITLCGNAADIQENTDFTLTIQIDNPVMTVNGTEQNIDDNGTTPEIRSERTLVPIRAIIEAMGGTVAWEQETQTVQVYNRCVTFQNILLRDKLITKYFGKKRIASETSLCYS